MMKLKLLAAVVAISSVAISAGSAHAQEAEEAPTMSTRAPSKKKKMRELFKILKAEPTVKEVQRWALKYYKLSPHRINSMGSNARLKGLVPEIDLSFENTQGNSFTNMRDGLYPALPNPAVNPNPDSLKERTAATNANNVLRVRAVWNLDRVVFNAESLDVKSLNSLGETLVREVATLYYSRRRLLASIVLSPPESPEELFFELTRLDEISSTLDALTGNKFSKKAWKWEESMLGM